MMQKQDLTLSEARAYIAARRRAKAVAKSGLCTFDQALAKEWKLPRPNLKVAKEIVKAARRLTADFDARTQEMAMAAIRQNVFGEEIPSVVDVVREKIDEATRRQYDAMSKALFENGGRPKADDLVGGQPGVESFIFPEGFVGQTLVRPEGMYVFTGQGLWQLLPTPAPPPAPDPPLSFEDLQRAYDDAWFGGSGAPTFAIPFSLEPAPTPKAAKKPAEPEPKLSKYGRVIRFEEED